MTDARPMPIPSIAAPAARRVMSSAADFVRQFGQWSRATTDEPLFVTHHGRPTHVMLSIAAYDALRHGTPAIADDALGRFADWIDDALIVCAADGTVTIANEAAEGLCALPPGHLAGRTLWAALPQLNATVFGALVRRWIASGEPGMADMPSPFRPGRWLRVRVRAADGAAAILLRDVTEQAHGRSGADETRALGAALDAQPGIGWLRLSPRGYIERASAPFCAMLMLPEERLREAALVDLAPRADRVALRGWLEDAWRTRTPSRLETSLVANDGGVVRVAASIADLSGPYVSDGAILVFDRLG